MPPERSRRSLPPPDKRLLTLSETMALTGFSRTRTYEAAREGTLPGLVRLDGHQMLVRRRVLEAWLDGLDAQESGGGRDGDEPDRRVGARSGHPRAQVARASRGSPTLISPR